MTQASDDCTQAHAGDGLIEDAVRNQHLAQIACGDMTADQIQRAYFGICSERYAANERDIQIGKKLRKKVTEVIEFRNSIAHGDWHVGTHDGQGTTFPPTLQRLRPGSSGAQWRGQELTPAYLDARSDELEELRKDIYFYSGLAGGMLFAEHGHRPSDMFQLVNNEIVRDGPLRIEGYVG